MPEVGVGRDTAFNLIAALSPIVFTLAATPFYLNAIGTDRFGILAICWTILAALSFTSLGMGPALTYRLALMKDAPPAERSSMAWTAILLGLTASLVGALLVFGAGEIYFHHLVAQTSIVKSEIGRALPLLAALLPLGILSGVLRGALQGKRRFGLLTVIALTNSGLTALVPLIVAYAIGPHLEQLLLATICANAFVLILQFGACFQAVPLRGWPQPRRHDAKLLLGYGAWMSVTALIAPLVLVSDRLVIGALTGPAAVAVYVLPYNFVQQMVYLPASLSDAIIPRIAAMIDDSEVRRLQSQSIAWLNGVLTPICIAAIASAAPFFRIWVGPALGSAAAPVAVILLVGAWVHGIGHIPSAIVVGRSRPEALAKLLLVYLVPYLLLLYFATRWFGIVGAATAWTIRAAFDPILFIHTRPYASDLRRVALSAALVFAAMAAALLLPWTSVSYWAVTCLILPAASYQNRKVLISTARNLRRARGGDIVANNSDVAGTRTELSAPVASGTRGVVSAGR